MAATLYSAAPPAATTAAQCSLICHLCSANPRLPPVQRSPLAATTAARCSPQLPPMQRSPPAATTAAQRSLPLSPVQCSPSACPHCNIAQPSTANCAAQLLRCHQCSPRCLQCSAAPRCHPPCGAAHPLPAVQHRLPPVQQALSCQPSRCSSSVSTPVVQPYRLPHTAAQPLAATTKAQPSAATPVDGHHCDLM